MNRYEKLVLMKICQAKHDLKEIENQSVLVYTSSIYFRERLNSATPAIIFRKFPNRSEPGSGPDARMVKCMALIMLGIVLGTSAIVNISLAFFIAAAWIPVVLLVRPTHSRLVWIRIALVSVAWDPINIQTKWNKIIYHSIIHQNMKKCAVEIMFEVIKFVSFLIVW